MTYHVGLAKRGKTLVIQACHSKDYLGCELYEYFGEFEVTKAHLHSKRYELLAFMQKSKPEVYNGLIYAVVE